MLLSVIIPTKNEEVYVSGILKDVRRQSFTDTELIVADARSTDETQNIARRFKAHIVEGGPPGVGRNAGAQVARGDILLFLDADVRLPHKHFLRDAVKELKARQLDLAASRVLPLDGRRVDMLMHRLYNAYARATVRFNPHAAGACLFAKRHIHQSLGGFDETITLAEDCEYVRRGSQLGNFGILKQSPVLISMRRHDREGRARMALKYLATETHIVRHGGVRDHAIEYDFEHHETPR